MHGAMGEARPQFSGGIIPPFSSHRRLASFSPVALRPNYPPVFKAAIARILDDEGGYVNNPDDPGGETKFGISKRSYPDLDIRSLTREDAVAIYFRDWWEKFGYDGVAKWQPAVAGKLLDLAVNIGQSHAVKCLQRAMRACGHNVAEDGIVGPQVLDRLELLAMRADALMVGLRCEAAGYYRTLAALSRGERADADRAFLKGWLNRAYE